MEQIKKNFKKYLELNSKVENINIIEKLIDEISEECSLSQEIYGKVLIAAIEAVNNAIVHGNKLDIEKKVFINIFVQENSLHMKVTDQGPGFDYKKVPDPTLPENIENIHGRGVFLMGHLADNINYNDKGNEVEMIFKLD